MIIVVLAHTPYLCYLLQAVMVLLILSIVSSSQQQDYPTTAKKNDAEYFR